MMAVMAAAESVSGERGRGERGVGRPSQPPRSSPDGARPVGVQMAMERGLDADGLSRLSHTHREWLMARAKEGGAERTAELVRLAELGDEAVARAISDADAAALVAACSRWVANSFARPHNGGSLVATGWRQA